MDYTLAKELKEVGWPQCSEVKRWPTFYNKDGVLGYTTYNFNGGGGDEGVYVPTLSELIEACGDKFFGVLLSPSAEYFERPWCAISTVDLEQPTLNTDWPNFAMPYNLKLRGNTSEEAVARLWIELQKLTK